MCKSKRQNFIDFAEKMKGKRGRFTHILSHYHHMIAKSHANNETIYTIMHEVEKDLGHSFSDGIDKVRDNPFYRALSRYIKLNIDSKKMKKVGNVQELNSEEIEEEIAEEKPKVKKQVDFGEDPDEDEKKEKSPAKSKRANLDGRVKTEVSKIFKKDK